MPDWCIKARRPTVFIATVFPPVFGPVITNVDHAGPMFIVTGTAPLPSRGWRAREPYGDVRRYRIDFGLLTCASGKG